MAVEEQCDTDSEEEEDSEFEAFQRVSFLFVRHRWQIDGEQQEMTLECQAIAYLVKKHPTFIWEFESYEARAVVALGRPSAGPDRLVIWP